MRNVFAIALVTFIVVCAGAYGITWYAQALSTKRGVEQAIAKINEKQQYLTYEAIETSGFPSTVLVSVVRPHFKGRIDEWFHQQPAPALPASGSNATQQWFEDVSLDGKITIGVNALSDHYTATISGNWNEASTIGGQGAASFHQQLSPLACVLQLERQKGLFDTLWSFDFLTGRDFPNDFRMLDCNSAGHKSMDAASKEPLSSVGLSRLYVTSAPQPKYSNIRFYLKITDAEVTPQGDARLARYVQALIPGYEMPIPYSAYGKQNIDMDITYAGPWDYKTSEGNLPLDVAVNKLDMTNQIYNSHIDFHLNNTPAGGIRNSTLTFRTESTLTEKYDMLVQNIVRTFIKHLSETRDPRFPNAEAMIQKYTPEQLYGIVSPAIPDFHSLGKLAASANGSFKGSEDLKDGDYILDGMELSAGIYGIAGKGSLKMVQNMPVGGTLQLSCASCLQMIDAMAAYAGRVRQMVSYFDPEKAQSMAIDPAQVDAFKQFLSILAVAQNPADKSMLFFNISGTGNNITVNGKSMADVATLYNEYIKPTLKTPPAASDGSPRQALPRKAPH